MSELYFETLKSRIIVCDTPTSTWNIFFVGSEVPFKLERFDKESKETLSFGFYSTIEEAKAEIVSRTPKIVFTTEDGIALRKHDVYYVYDIEKEEVHGTEYVIRSEDFSCLNYSTSDYFRFSTRLIAEKFATFVKEYEFKPVRSWETSRSFYTSDKDFINTFMKVIT